MNRLYKRKSAFKVARGHVEGADNRTKSATLGYTIDSKRPGRGFRHVVRKRDIHDFTDMIPGWDDLSVGIESIILCAGDDYAAGHYDHFTREGTGSIYLYAWDEDLWMDVEQEYFQLHKWIFDALGLVYEEKQVQEPDGRGQCTEWGCFFSESQARAFMLTYVFLHELGHHVDTFRSKNRDTCIGGEQFAEEFSKKMFKEIWPVYVERFGNPERQ